MSVAHSRKRGQNSLPSRALIQHREHIRMARHTSLSCLRHRTRKASTEKGEEEEGSMRLAEQRKQAEKEGLIGQSDYLRIKEGQNRIRIVSDGIPHPGEFKGKRTFKWIFYVIDRADGNLKPYFMPNRVFDMIADLQGDEEYAFEGMPMPYDIVVNAKNAGTIDVEYSVTPRKPSKLTAEELNALDAAKPLKELREQLRAKSEKVAPHTDGFDPDNVTDSIPV